MSSTRYKTYKEWRAEGCQVRRGSKHVKRNKNGECLFHSDQVDILRDNYVEQYCDDFDYDEWEWHPGNPADYGFS